VHLEPKVYELLVLLLERHPAAVSKKDIHERLWPRTFVSEASLTTVVKELRRVLGPGPVRTVRGFGYAFEGELRPGARPECPHESPRFLVWNERLLPLREGENVVGRDPEADVVVDVPGVSRRHALVRVASGQATVEDLGSKNGTFLAGERIAGRVALADLDTLCLGQTVLVYRCPGTPPPTRTEAV
jgi:hypothetical protein